MFVRSSSDKAFIEFPCFPISLSSKENATAGSSTDPTCQNNLAVPVFPVIPYMLLYFRLCYKDVSM